MSDSEQQEHAAVDAYMRGMGYERQRYSRFEIKGWRKPTADARMYFFVEYEQALDFYRTTQAQVAEAVHRIDPDYMDSSLDAPVNLGAGWL